MSDEDKLASVEVFCPKCGYKNIFVFKSGKQLKVKLIEDIIRRLESHQFMEGDDILEEIQYWEEMLKDE